MEYRVLGTTGIRVSAVASGAGPVSGWMSEPGQIDAAVAALQAGGLPQEEVQRLRRAGEEAR